MFFQLIFLSVQNMTFTDDGWSRTSIFLLPKWDSFVCNTHITRSLSHRHSLTLYHHSVAPPTEPSRNILTVAVKESNAHALQAHMWKWSIFFSFFSVNATDRRLGREHCMFSFMNRLKKWTNERTINHKYVFTLRK